jgi:hypothetical protein
MSAAKDTQLVCVGPTGIGYYAVIDRLPQRDTGEWASLSGAMLMSDAPIVASEVAKRYNVSLISNNLGGSAESSLLRKHVLGLNITLLEDPIPVRGVPFDMIMLERRTESRTFVTTSYSPKPAHISRAISQIAKRSGCDGGNMFLYVDAEYHSPASRETVAVLNSLTFEPTLTLVNLDDVSDLSAAFRWIAAQNVRPPVVFQMSFKGKIDYGADLRSLWDSGHTIIVTSGGGGVHLLSPGLVRHIQCDEVRDSLTIGAGAILSGALLFAVISARLGTVTESALAAAVREASSFVKDFSRGKYRHNVFLW